jgi:hypothetical protein
METNRQKDIYTFRETDRQAGRQAGWQADRQADEEYTIRKL